MGAGALDSAVLRGLFTTAPMRAVFADARRLQYCLDVEAALARVQAGLGLIPAAAAAEIARNCVLERFDLDRLRRDTEHAGSPILPLTRQLAALCAGDSGQWCHWGATTQDIADTALVLQLRDALDLLGADLDAVRDGLAALARLHRDTPMAGRSFLQHAAPITFGYKLAVTLAALDRQRARLDQLRPRVLVGQFGGAVGTLAALGERGLAVRAALMQALGLGEPEITWHAARDRVAEVGCWLALLAGTLGKFAVDVKLLAQTEVAEVAEPAAPGRGASSTMPQKRNPVAAVQVVATTALVRTLLPALLEATTGEHERGAGAWQMEWVALPEMALLSAGALAAARLLAEGLVADPARMLANLGATGGLIASESVMMALAPRLGRQRAHAIVAEAAAAALAGGFALPDLLAARPEVAAEFDLAALRRLLDPADYVGAAGAMVDHVLQQRSASGDRDTGAAAQS